MWWGACLYFLLILLDPDCFPLAKVYFIRGSCYARTAVARLVDACEGKSEERQNDSGQGECQRKEFFKGQGARAFPFGFARAFGIRGFVCFGPRACSPPWTADGPRTGGGRLGAWGLRGARTTFDIPSSPWAIRDRRRAQLDDWTCTMMASKPWYMV